MKGLRKAPPVDKKVQSINKRNKKNNIVRSTLLKITYNETKTYLEKSFTKINDKLPSELAKNFSVEIRINNPTVRGQLVNKEQSKISFVKRSSTIRDINSNKNLIHLQLKDTKENNIFESQSNVLELLNSRKRNVAGKKLENSKKNMLKFDLNEDSFEKERTATEGEDICNYDSDTKKRASKERGYPVTAHKKSSKKFKMMPDFSREQDKEKLLIENSVAQLKKIVGNIKRTSNPKQEGGVKCNSNKELNLITEDIIKEDSDIDATEYISVKEPISNVFSGSISGTTGSTGNTLGSGNCSKPPRPKFSNKSLNSNSANKRESSSKYQKKYVNNSSKGKCDSKSKADINNSNYISLKILDDEIDQNFLKDKPIKQSVTEESDKKDKDKTTKPVFKHSKKNHNSCFNLPAVQSKSSNKLINKKKSSNEKMSYALDTTDNKEKSQKAYGNYQDFFSSEKNDFKLIAKEISTEKTKELKDKEKKVKNIQDVTIEKTEKVKVRKYKENSSKNLMKIEEKTKTKSSQFKSEGKNSKNVATTTIFKINPKEKFKSDKYIIDSNLFQAESGKEVVMEDVKCPFPKKLNFDSVSFENGHEINQDSTAKLSSDDFSFRENKSSIDSMKFFQGIANNKSDELDNSQFNRTKLKELSSKQLKNLKNSIEKNSIEYDLFCHKIKNHQLSSFERSKEEKKNDSSSIITEKSRSALSGYKSCYTQHSLELEFEKRESGL